VTTEHFTLQDARSSTIAEATGRAAMFLGAVSGGPGCPRADRYRRRRPHSVLRFRAHPAAHAGLRGLATFNRVLQSGIEDLGYASRIARLRGYYFQSAPELAGYLLSVPPAERLRLQGIGGGRRQKFLTVAAMAGLVTAVLADSAAGLLAAVVSDHALIAGPLVAIAVFAALIRFQVSTWRRAAALLLDDE
jgi:hypothetical protein